MNLHEAKNMSRKQRSEVIRRHVSLLSHPPRQCQHLKSNGEFCGSPALRGRSYCYFHLTHIGRRMRAERNHAAALRMQKRASASESANPTLTVPFELPPLEDLNSIQVALMQVIDAVLHNRIDSKRAGLVLYALQTASANLARGADFRQSSGAAVAARYDDFEDDFQLGDAAQELKSDEVTEQKQEASAHAKKIAEIEELAEAYSKLDKAREEAQSKGIYSTPNLEGQPVSNDDADDEGDCESAQCDAVAQLICSLKGPLSRARSEPSTMVRVERAAASQRLELLPTLSPEENDDHESAA